MKLAKCTKAIYRKEKTNFKTGKPTVLTLALISGILVFIFYPTFSAEDLVTTLPLILILGIWWFLIFLLSLGIFFVFTLLLAWKKIKRIKACR